MACMQLQTADSQNDGAPLMFQQLASACKENFDITRFTSRMEPGLVKLGLLSPQGAFDNHMQETLLDQLTILFNFCARVKSGTDQLHFLHYLCEPRMQSITSDTSQPVENKARSQSHRAHSWTLLSCPAFYRLADVTGILYGPPCSAYGKSKQDT